MESFKKTSVGQYWQNKGEVMISRYKRSLFLLASLLFCNVTISISKEYDPLLVVVMMVKNEEDVIVGTLEPFVKAHIDSYLIFDTGSTDNTVAVTKKYFQEQNIVHGYIEQEPFVDFATSRNRALRLAEEKFPNAAFMIMVDAEWYFQNVPDLLKMCATLRHDSERSYLVRVVWPDVELYIPYLFRCRTGLVYKGVVHEIIQDKPKYKLPETVYFLTGSTAQKKSPERWQRDAQLLLKEVEKDPYDTRSLYYLGHTYMFLGDWDNAIKYFKRRIMLKGFDEEDYMAHYRLAYSLDNKYASDESGWPLALENYLKAYSVRPSRIEPLIRIAFHYLAKGEMHLAYLYTFGTLQKPYPQNDVLFVEKIVYDLARYYIISQTASVVGEYEMGEFATRKALQVRPQDTVLKKNLAMYQALIKQ